MLCVDLGAQGASNEGRNVRGRGRCWGGLEDEVGSGEGCWRSYCARSTGHADLAECTHRDPSFPSGSQRAHWVGLKENAKPVPSAVAPP